MLLACTVLFSSCYSHRVVHLGYSPMQIGQKYDIKQGDSYERVTLKGITDSTLIVASKGIERPIRVA